MHHLASYKVETTIQSPNTILPSTVQASLDAQVAGLLLRKYMFNLISVWVVASDKIGETDPSVHSLGDS